MLQALPEVRRPLLRSVDDRVVSDLIFIPKRLIDQAGSLAAIALHTERPGVVGKSQIVQSERVTFVGGCSVEPQGRRFVARLAAHSILIEIAQRRGRPGASVPGG